MRRIAPWSVALLVLVAIPLAGHAANQYGFRVDFLGGIQVGSSGTIGTAANKVTKMLGASSSIDFAGATDQCEDSSGITVTGATAGDPCSVGSPATPACTHCWVTCYVSAADTVKVRLCAHGASGNPAAATYYVRVISSQ